MSNAILNIDNSHFFFTRKAESADASAITAFIDQYDGTQVAEIRFCVNCMKSSYNSKVFEPLWKGFDPQGGPDQPFLLAIADEEERRQFDNLMKCAFLLSQDGKNVYQTWIERCRTNGISPWISTRMNDVHSVENEDHPLHSSFWKDHPEFRRAPYHFTSLTDKALDFGQKAVRDHHFEFIREIAELYDMDGLELDWMRFGYHFRPGFEEEGAKLLTAFVSDVRALLDQWQTKRGHRIELSARVPSRPATALALGMDAVAWARKKLVSRLVITPFWATSETDMPIELWKQLLDGTGVRLEAGLEVLLRAYPASPLFQTNSIETVRGAAMSYLARGADDIYLFNYFDKVTCMDDLENYPVLLREIGKLETLRGKERRHVVTFADTWGVGEASGYLLPCVLGTNDCRAFRISIGEKPNGQKAYAVLGFNANDNACADSRRLWVNGTLCKEEKTFLLKNPRPDSTILAYQIENDALHNGINVIEVMGYNGTINWVEINIQ